jgi:cysteine desulfurase
MYVNNEIGTVEPVEEIAKLVKEKNPETYFHVDAIQAYGKFRIYPKKSGIDLLSVSGHKIHGPKGVGFLYVSEGVKIKPVIYGGGQQKGMRSGTDNVPGIAGLGVAAELAYDHFEEKQEKLYELREHFISGIAQIDGVEVNGRTDRTFAPHIVNIRVAKVRAEVLLHALEDKQIYVSAGSACSSNKPAPSKTLLAIGVPKEAVGSSIRISFCAENTNEQVDYLIGALKEIVPMLQKYVRK